MNSLRSTEVAAKLSFVSSSAPLSAKRIPGNMAIWAIILAEMSEFAIMFVVYFLAKVHNPEVFFAGPTKLNTTAGTVNTLIMLTSSFFVVKGVMAMRQGFSKTCTRWLWGAVLCGVVYLVIKYFEYEWNTAQGLDTETNIFYGVYYYVTFNHFLHVGWGSAAIIWVIYLINRGIYTKDEHEGLINIALYWHMIDLAWITIFPLLYVIR